MTSVYLKSGNTIVTDDILSVPLSEAKNSHIVELGKTNIGRYRTEEVESATHMDMIMSFGEEFFGFSCFNVVNEITKDRPSMAEDDIAYHKGEFTHSESQRTYVKLLKGKTVMLSEDTAWECNFIPDRDDRLEEDDRSGVDIALEKIHEKLYAPDKKQGYSEAEIHEIQTDDGNYYTAMSIRMNSGVYLIFMIELQFKEPLKSYSIDSCVVVMNKHRNLLRFDNESFNELFNLFENQLSWDYESKKFKDVMEVTRYDMREYLDSDASKRTNMKQNLMKALHWKPLFTDIENLFAPMYTRKELGLEIYPAHVRDVFRKEIGRIYVNGQQVVNKNDLDNVCMREYKKCQIEHQWKHGGRFNPFDGQFYGYDKKIDEKEEKKVLYRDAEGIIFRDSYKDLYHYIWVDDRFIIADVNRDAEFIKDLEERRTFANKMLAWADKENAAEQKA